MKKHIILFLSILFVYNFLQYMPMQAFAAAIPTGQLHTPIGAAAPTARGDYISSSAGMNSYYSYFIEVPPGLAQMRVQIYDGNVYNFFSTYDGLSGTWNTYVTYTLYPPPGSPLPPATTTCSPGLGSGACSEAAWGTLATVPNPTAGHWELRVDMSSNAPPPPNTQGNDVNGFGLRAHDGNSGSGGTELNIYAESFVEVGPYAGGSSYQLYPFITSGCTADSNDFDWKNSGSISFTSRTGAFSQSNPSVSPNDAWVNTPFSGWTTDFWSADYGIWNANLTLSPDDNDIPGADDNYGTFYIGNFAAATPTLTSPPSAGGPPSAQPEANTFRLYLPTDGGGAPVKPILTQTLSYVSGANPPVVGSTTRVRVQVTVFNPTLFPITFSSTNLVTANIPGSGVVYAGIVFVSQGSITSQPATGGTGDITWNPGTVAANSNATLTFDVDVTPTAAGRIPVTGTPASNGTTAKYVDETGNTTQARATYTYGPICELAVTVGTSITPTLAVVSSFEAYEANGKVVVQWETASEIDTAGFYLFRLDESTGNYLQINQKLVPALLTSPQGGTYSLIDRGVSPGRTYTYMLVEVEGKGTKQTYGPFMVVLGKENAQGRQKINPSMDYSRKAHDISADKKARLKASKEQRNTAWLFKKQRSGRMAKISISEDGLYYLDASEISPLLGISTENVISLIKMNNLSISNQGQKVAYIPTADNTGIFFYGQGIDSIYTKENIYWLKQSKGLKMEIIGGAGAVPDSGEETFTETIHLEEDHWAPTALFDDPQSDFWLWDYIVSGDPTMGRKTFNLRAQGVADTSEIAAITINLHGATNTNHHVVVTLNGIEIGESRWDGTKRHEVTLSFSQDLLNDGNNILQLNGILDTGVPYSIFYIDSFDLTYHRLYHADGNSLLCRADSNPVVTVSGFTDPKILVFEVSNPGKPKLINATTVDKLGVGNYRVSFRPTSPESLYLALTIDRLSSPVSLIADRTSRLKESSNRADYLIIAPEELKDTSKALANYRQSQGLITMVADLEDIMDEFNYGIYSPEAIRDFLSYAYHNWRKAPRYVVLIGEGTYDYKDNQGHGGNLILPIMIKTPRGLFPSDNHFADINGDHIPEMAIGRLPVVTSEELIVLIRKIIAYENSNGDTWTKRVLMLADNPDDCSDFPADSNNVATLLPQGYTAEKIYLSEYPIDIARQLVLEGINNGALLLNYIGHAGLDRLAQGGLLLNSDVASMTNQERLPVVTAMTCVTGHFAIPGYDSLAEVLVLKQNGGAVAVLSPTGMSINSEAVILDKAFFQTMFEKRQALGDVVLKALEKGSMNGVSGYILSIYNILGDPALKLK